MEAIHVRLEGQARMVEKHTATLTTVTGNIHSKRIKPAWNTRGTMYVWPQTTILCRNKLRWTRCKGTEHGKRKKMTKVMKIATSVGIFPLSLVQEK